MKNKFKKAKRYEKWVFLLIITVFLVTLFYLVNIYVGGWFSRRKMEELASSMCVSHNRIVLSQENGLDKELNTLLKEESVGNIVTSENIISETTIKGQKDDINFAPDMIADILPKFTSLYEENSDIIGWLSIKDTNINYPVMYTPWDPEYYIHRNFRKEYEKRGLPFLDGNTDFIESRNYIIYGHNMHDGTGFKDILKYKDENFYREHPIIQFDTIYETAEYEVIAAFYTKIFNIGDEDFKYYKYIDILDESTYEEYIKGILELSLYDTKSDILYKDRLITLSTCSYHTKEGRFVLVAKKK